MTIKQFYKNDFPEINDIVLGRVISITKYGINIKLIEYDNLTAFLNFKDASNKKRLYQIKKIIKINREYPLTVIDVDKKKKYVSLSKRYQEKEDEEDFIDFFKKYKKCRLVMSNFVRNKKLVDISDQIAEYDKILWKHDRNDIYTIFSTIKKDEITVNKHFDISDEEYNILYKVICNTLQDVRFTIKFNIKINSLAINGKQAIINYLDKIKDSEEIVPYIISIPNYCLEYKNILEKNVDQFIESKKIILNKLPKNDVLCAIVNVEKYEQ